MALLQDMLVRNGYIGNINGHKFTLKEDYGYITLTWSSTGKTTRLHKAENKVDLLVDLPDGSNLRINPSALF